ncbi:TPA: hypothetical protein N0F65_012804 [Lagenidium giganteum]|uniref:TRAF3-interacting protein 1 n=1 Tax=Lagenidium giganteum TaxID=4803 RepID=A0AAV2YGW2_9STRA|nr:TPA: hypothetical protein N0F65_012804 [Lagenidium giganteum]
MLVPARERDVGHPDEDRLARLGVEQQADGEHHQHGQRPQQRHGRVLGRARDGVCAQRPITFFNGPTQYHVDHTMHQNLYFNVVVHNFSQSEDNGATEATIKEDEDVAADTMGEPLEALIPKTQEILQPLIAKPKLADKLLTKPPFRFIHDIFTAVTASTGFATGLYNDFELDSANIKEKNQKLAYLDKMIVCVGQTLGRDIDVRSAKIVAGLEAENTNVLLQELARAASNSSLDWAKGVQKALEKVPTMTAENPNGAIGDAKPSSAGGAAAAAESKAESKAPAETAPPRPASKEKEDPEKAAAAAEAKARERARREEAAKKEKTEAVKEEQPRPKADAKADAPTPAETKPRAASRESAKPNNNTEVDDAVAAQIKECNGDFEKTKDMIEKIIAKPKMAVKLLSKPPFRFIHDIVSEITRVTGFAEGLYAGEELDSASIKEKGPKIDYLTKIIQCVSCQLNVEVEAKPAKIVAGLEPEDTNKFLQLMAIACKTGSSADAVKRVLSGDTALREASSKKSSSSKTLDREPTPEAKLSSRSSTPQEAKKRDAAPKEAKEEASAPTIAAAAAATAGFSGPMKPLALKGGDDDDNASLRFDAGAKDTGEEGSIVPPGTSGGLGSSRTSRPTTARRRPPKLKENVTEVGRLLVHDTKVAPVTGIMKDGDNADSDDEGAGDDHGNQTQHGSSAMMLEDGGSHGRLVRDILKDQNAEEAARKQKEDEDQKEGPSEIETGIRLGRRKKSFKDKSKSAASSVAEMNELRLTIQKLCQAANPVGKCVEFVHEDLEAMSKELDKWKKEYEKKREAYEEEKKKTEEALQPLQVQLLEVEELVKEHVHKINTVKATIAKNEEKTQKLLRMRRPSDGATHRGNMSARAKNPGGKEEETRPATLENAGATATTSANNATKDAQHDDEVVSKTFITALVAAKRSKSTRFMSRLLEDSAMRPPSPLEPLENTASDYLDQPNEPVVINYIGGEALDKFWNMFHRQDVVTNNTFMPIEGRPASPPTIRSGSMASILPSSSSSERPKSARTTYLTAIRKMKLSPEPMGVVRRRIQEKGNSTTPQEINLNNYNMGDDYATAFSDSFPLVPAVEVLNMASNRISDEVGAQLITNVVRSPPQSLQHLNFASNNLGHASAQALSDLLMQSKTLCSLNLAHNQLRDRDIITLCEALEKNQTLVRLHLSENKFGLEGMIAIARFLEENAKIEEVYLSWNQLRGVGALKIVESLKFHASLRAVDLSWNSLDSNELLKPRSIVNALADALANNKVLSHLDLSNNHLDMEDCNILARQLEYNHTLVGLHMSGNCGSMDSRGYLIPKQIDSKLVDQHKFYSIALFEETYSESGSGSFPTHLAQVVDKYCWYCGNWSEYRFAWTPHFEVLSTQSVHLHVSVDDWRGIEMERRDDGSFSSYRVLPPGKTEYFFTVVDKHDTSSVTFHYIKEKRHSRLHHHPKTGRDQIFGDLERINFVRMGRRDGRDPCNSLLPRTCKNSDRSSKWDINKSVFARRRRESVARSYTDTDPFMQKACAADWRQCKVDRFIKDPVRRKDVEITVTKHFRMISSIYRKYCGHNLLTSIAVVSNCTPAVANQLQNDVISVPWSGYIEFVNDCKILDENSDYCRLADLENVFVAANLELTQEAKEKDNPDRSLTRFEFLECVMRIAINKYHRSNICDTPAKAIDKLMQDNILPNCPEDANEFRVKFLYTEEISEIFSENIALLQEIYSTNMGRYCKPGEKKGMQLVEYLSVMERYQVFNDTFRIRDVKDPFLACKLVVLDEMATVGHKKLFTTDFMELLLRISVLRYPPKPFTAEEVAKSLQKLFQNHFSKHETLLDQFRETVDNAMVQERVEMFTSAINTNKKKQQSQRANARIRRSSSITEEEDDESGEAEDVSLVSSAPSTAQPASDSTIEAATWSEDDHKGPANGNEASEAATTDVEACSEPPAE